MCKSAVKHKRYGKMRKSRLKIQETNLMISSEGFENA